MSAAIQSLQTGKANLIDVQVADYLNISLSTVRRWRLTGGGPRWIRIGGCVRYPASDLAAYLSQVSSGGGIREAR